MPGLNPTMLADFALQNLHALTVLALIPVMLALFVRERIPAEVVAMLAVAVLLATGILSPESGLEVLSNPAPWTIVAMFILSGALVRTGTLGAVSAWISGLGTARPAAVLAAMAALVIFASAFVNNTPVVLMMIPVVMGIGKRLGIAPSRLLIPLSYFSIFGGICTLIGSSTNLLVDGVARSAGMEPFSIFEITPLGLALAAFGLIYLVLLGPRLLPDRESLGSLVRDRAKMRYITEVVVAEGSALAGHSPADIGQFRRPGVRIVSVLRDETQIRGQFDDITLRAGDRIMIRTGAAELPGLRQAGGLGTADFVSSRQTRTLEALISPRSSLVDRRLSALKLPRRYGIFVLAVHSPRRTSGIRQLDSLVVRVGDTLLLEGAPSDIHRFAEDLGVLEISEPVARPYRRAQAPIAILALAGAVILAALGIMPIYALGIIAVALVLVSRCIDFKEALSFVDGRLLALIFSMLAVGSAMESSGAIALLTGTISPLLLGLHPILVVWCVYVLTSMLTELISNSAVAVVMAPVAIGLATALGVDPRPLVVAVMVAASASFATPIGYQTNTLVYGPGGYRFADFARIGLPLNICFGVISSILIPLIWPL